MMAKVAWCSSLSRQWVDRSLAGEYRQVAGARHLSDLQLDCPPMPQLPLMQGMARSLCRDYLCDRPH